MVQLVIQKHITRCRQWGYEISEYVGVGEYLCDVHIPELNGNTVEY